MGEHAFRLTGLVCESAHVTILFNINLVYGEGYVFSVPLVIITVMILSFQTDWSGQFAANSADPDQTVPRGAV